MTPGGGFPGDWDCLHFCLIAFAKVIPILVNKVIPIPVISYISNNTIQNKTIHAQYYNINYTWQGFHNSVKPITADPHSNNITTNYMIYTLNNYHSFNYKRLTWKLNFVTLYEV